MLDNMKPLGTESFEGKDVLVTGGAGFLGSWICETLLTMGANVEIIDNFSSGQRANLPRNARVDALDVSKIFPKGKYDYIIHGASRASPDEYQAHPVDTVRTNAIGMLNVLESARKYDSTVLLMSTSEVYGNARVIPTPETYWGEVNPIGIRSCYDEGKRYAEAAAMAYVRQYGLGVVIIRIFNTYGPRIRADGYYARALPKFIASALAGEPITVYGDGTQTRSFTYVSDTVRGILLALAKPDAKNKCINIGNNVETSIIELARLVIRMTDSASQIVFKDLPADDPQRRCPDIRLAKSLLNWEPEVTLEEGLAHTIQWFKQHQPRV